VTLRRNNEDDPLAPHSLSPRELKDLLGVERAGAPFLVFRDEGGHLAFFATAGQNVYRIGRRREADLAIEWDPEVSGLHAELQGLGGEWVIVDDGLSTNGTFVNGVRVNGRRRLRDGDRVRVGRTILVYKPGGQAQGSQTAVAGQTATLQELTDTQRRVLIALCRPYRDGESATPATNQQIADEVILSVDAVKMHLRALFVKFGLSELAQNEKRMRLAERALQFGVVTERDLT
jgi:predicted component of type VI protein secretion system